MSHVTADSFLTLHYRLSGADGMVFMDTFGDKPATLTLGTGVLSPVLEQKLVGLREGEQVQIELPAGAGFGDRRPELQQWVSAKLLNDISGPEAEFAIGDVIQFPAEQDQLPYAGRVLAKREDGAVLFDFNHPLAGQAVRFDVHVIGIL